MKYLVAVLALAVVLPAQAETLDLNISENALAGSFSGALPSTVSGLYDFGALYRASNKGDLKNFHGGVLLTGDTGAKNVNLVAGLGLRALVTDSQSNQGTAVAFGGQLEAKLPFANRINTRVSAYYAPSMTSFSDLESYREVAASIGYEVIRNGTVYGGWRNVREDFDLAGKYTVDNGFHAGFRLTF